PSESFQLVNPLRFFGVHEKGKCAALGRNLDVCIRGNRHKNALLNYGFSKARSRLLISRGRENPPISPLLRTTRWQGIQKGRGFFPQAAPTARAASGLSREDSASSW